MAQNLESQITLLSFFKKNQYRPHDSENVFEDIQVVLTKGSTFTKTAISSSWPLVKGFTTQRGLLTAARLAKINIFLA